MENLKVAIGADHAGFELKEQIIEYFKRKNIEYKDFGTFSEESCDYPKYAKEVSIAVAKGDFNRGILVCGSGIGMAVTANKVKGIHAALCFNLATAKSARTHNNSNVLCLGHKQTDDKLSLEMVDVWLHTDFEGGRHQKRIDMIEELEK